METRGRSELRYWARHALKAEVATSTGSLEQEAGGGSVEREEEMRGMTECAEVPKSYSG